MQNPQGSSPSGARISIILACLLASLLADTRLWASTDPTGQSTTTQKPAQPKDPAPQPAQKPNPDTQNEPVKIDATVTVFGQAEPKKTEISNDVRSLPVHSSLLQEVELRRRTYREPAEMLRSLPGVDFVYYGQGGIPSGPSVRGYTDRNFGQDMSGHLDGIPLNIFGFVASHGALDLTSIVPETIARIELIRGPLDARYGDFNRGASLNYVTKDAVVRPSLTLNVGTFGTWRAAGAYGWSQSGGRGASFYSTVDGHHTEGYSDRQALGHVKSFHKLRIPFGTSDLSVTASTFWTEWDAPSYIDLAQLKSGALDDKDAVSQTDGGNQNSQLFSVRYRHAAATPNELSATVYVRRLDWRRFRSDFLISPTQTQVRQLDDRVTLGYRVEKNIGHTLFGRRSMFVAGTTLHRDDADTSIANTLNRNVLRVTDEGPLLLTSIGAFAQEHLQLSDRFKVMGGLRYSHVDYEIGDALRAPGAFVADYANSQVSPKVGVAFAPIRTVDIYANVATGMRSPTPRTEVRNSLGSLDRVEIADTASYEAGARTLLFDRVELHGNVWRADNSNEIRGIPPGTEFESLGKSRRDGYGLDARVFVGPVTRVLASVSWLDARVLTPANPAANRLPDIPDFVHQIGVETGIPLARQRPESLVLTADYSFYGEKNLNTIGSLRSERYGRLTFRAVYEPSNRYRVHLGGFAYPGSRTGESAFLFGSRIGVRPNPRISVDTGISYLF
ncbi:MAG: TonB-dependent receptor [Acidobacteriota bacterium]|nr:TonB-dependent receptor [Acidobacteriota bacterium]